MAQQLLCCCTVQGKGKQMLQLLEDDSNPSLWHLLPIQSCVLEVWLSFCTLCPPI